MGANVRAWTGAAFDVPCMRAWHVAGGDHRDLQMRILVWIVAVAAGALLVVTFGDSPIAADLKFGHALESLLYGAIAVSMASYLLLQYRGKLGIAVLSAIAWIAIFAVVIVGYTYRRDLEVVTSRVLDEIVPGRSVSSTPGQAVIVRSGNGHFFMDGITNGKTLRYMFDTGASSVVLTADDASRIGFSQSNLSFDTTVSTANGRTQAAAIRIDALTIGSVTLRDVRALVARPGALRENLLGMSFLGRLASYTVSGNRLVLQR